MKNRLKRLCSVAIILAMLISCVTAFASDTEEIVNTEIVSEKIPVIEEVTEEIPRVIGKFEEKNADRTILYVATNGDDTNDGTIDAPFATIEKAKNTIRSMKTSNTLGTGGAVVYVRGGTYVLTKGVEFAAEDAGTKDAPVIYRNYPDEKVEFIGAAAIPWNAFKKVTDESVLNRLVDSSVKSKLYEADLFALGFKELPQPLWPGPYSYWEETIGPYLRENGIVQPKGNASELIIDGKAMTVARYPNDGYLTIEEVVDPGSNTDPFKPFIITIDDDRVKYWENAKEALLTGTFQYSWAQHTTQLGKAEGAKNRLTSKYPIHYQATKGQQFYIYNLVEEIDLPGEYYIDRETGKLYFYPLDGEPESIMYTILEDTMFSFNKTQYITIEGFGMKYMRYKPFTMSSGTVGCTVENCEITFTSSNASVEGINCKILDCHFYDAEGGVSLGGGNRETLTRANNLVENCTFERCDRITKTYKDSVALNGVGNIARNNYLADTDHLLARMSGNDHLYEFNEFAYACKNTDDMGALYTGRDLTQRGNEVRFNYFHDIGGANRGTNGVHGIFFDDFWSAANVVGNVFENITGAGCMAAGSHNVFSNNIFIKCGESLRLTRSFDYGNPMGYETYTSTVKPYMYSDLWLERYPTIKDAVDEEGRPDINHNITATNNILIDTMDVRTSDEIAETIIMENNIFFGSDPGFYDAENKNYLLKEDSTVFEKIPDFVQIPTTRIGTYSDRAAARIKNSYVYCFESPYVFKNGEKVKEEKAFAVVENNVAYITLRAGAEAVGATVDYDEQTDSVKVSTSSKTITFASGGSVDRVLVNGTEYKLDNPVINKDYTNYIAMTDLVNIFEKQLLFKNSIAVISDTQALFTDRADDGLLRYIEAKLSLY